VDRLETHPETLYIHMDDNIVVKKENIQNTLYAKEEEKVKLNKPSQLQIAVSSVKGSRPPSSHYKFNQSVRKVS